MKTSPQDPAVAHVWVRQERLAVGPGDMLGFRCGCITFFPLYIGFTVCKPLALCKHGTPRAPYISRATAFIALSHGHVIATDTCFYNTASIICRQTSAHIRMKLFLPQSFSSDHTEPYTRSVTELQSTSHSAMPQGRTGRLADSLSRCRLRAQRFSSQTSSRRRKVIRARCNPRESEKLTPC